MKRTRFTITVSAVLMVVGFIGSNLFAEKTSGSGSLKTNDTRKTEIEQMLQTARAAISESRAGEQINWQVIASGGTDGNSTNYNLTGTTGQLVVGSGSSTNYGLKHGYWQDFASSGTCCMGAIRGNVDYDAGDAIDISDLVYLVDFMFNSGPEPPCFEEGDIDGSGSPPINISDLVYLVDFMFSGGPQPPSC